MNVALVLMSAVIVGAALAGFALYVEHSWKAFRIAHADRNEVRWRND